MLELRFFWFWWLLGSLMVAGVCVGSLMPVSSLPSAFEVEDKVLHVGAYGLLMIWFAGMFARHRHSRLAAALILLGLALDLLQGRYFSRSFEWGDVAADAIGVGIGWALCRSLLTNWCQRIEHRFAG